jgi:hypothetical protein
MATSTALTRWLRQGLAAGICPLCRAAHKLDREFIWHFFDEYSSHGEAIDELRASGGFCGDHAEQLRRLEVDGLRSTLGITLTYLDTLEGIAADLGSLRASGAFRRRRCPACAYRDDGVAKNAGYLLADLSESERIRERFAASPGLCLAHFELVWERAATTADRALLLEVQRRSVARVVAALRADVDGRAVDDAGRPAGEAGHAWRDAIALTSGWPAPDAPTGVPERAVAGRTEP